jgi:hypothetical protein
MAAVQAATTDPARFMGQAERRGTVEVGKAADLVLLNRDPELSSRWSKTIPSPPGETSKSAIAGSGDYAFAPTCNSATLKGTPHPPIPQYPSGFFARYCW